jgi:type I restriction enzyme S subunit
MAEQVSSLKTGIKYKDTPIGKIPVDWEMVRLGTIADFKNGINFKKEQRGEEGILTVDVLNMYSEIIFINPTNLYRVNIDLTHNQDYILKEGDILFVRSSVKREGVGWASLFKPFDEPVTFCGFIIRARLLRKNIIPNFLIYFLRSNSMRENLISGAGQVAITNISQNTLQNLNIVIPPLPEQQKIAEILTTIDEAIEKTTQIIEKTREAKKGLMQRLLTRGIGHKKFKKTEIGEIPEEWEVVTFKEIAKEFYNGGTPDTNNKQYWDGSIPWITGADFDNQRVTRIRRYITEEGLKNSATNVISRGNLLIVTRTGVGKLAIAPFDIAISQDITGIIFDSSKALPEYIYWYLNHKASTLVSMVQGTSINGILRGDLETVRIFLPSISEQKQIEEILYAIDNDIEKETSHKEQLESLKKGLMQVLLTGKVRVNV